MISAYTRKQVAMRVEELIERTKEHYGILIPIPEIKFTLRGPDAGRTDVIHHKIALNPFYINEQPAEYIFETVGHEVAHLVVTARHGMRVFNHGQEWREVMKCFNIPANISHGYDIRAVKSLKRIWVCECSQHYVDPKLHRAMLGGKIYTCSFCKCDVKLHIH